MKKEKRHCCTLVAFVSHCLWEMVWQCPSTLQKRYGGKGGVCVWEVRVGWGVMKQIRFDVSYITFCSFNVIV